MLLYVVANQIAYVVVVRLANDDALNAMGRGYASYVNAFVLWQLPHAVVAVSVITALLPRMSRSAADGRLEDLRGELNRGLRLTVTVLVPAAIAYLVLGRVLATVVFGHLRTTDEQAQFIGVLLGVFAFGLVPFSVYQLQLRAFYAMQDTRTPTLDQPVRQRHAGGGRRRALHAAARSLRRAGARRRPRLLVPRWAGPVLAGASRRIGGLDGALVIRTAVRCLAAAALPGLVAAGLVAAVLGVLGDGQVGSLTALLLGSAVLGTGYLLAARRLGIAELDDVVAPILRRLGLARS